MPAFRELVVVHEFGICLLRPTLRSGIELIGKDAHRNRDGDTFDTEERNLRSEVLPAVACFGGSMVPRIQAPVSWLLQSSLQQIL
jgi:hypothetical protein